MNKVLFFSVFFVLGWLCPVLIVAQSPHGMVVSEELLPAKYQKKLKQAVSFLRKGEKLFDKAGELQAQLNQNEAEGTSGKLKDSRLQEHRQRLQRKAGTYIEDAHRLQYRILVKVLRHECYACYRGVEQQVKQHFKDAEVIRRKAENLSFRTSSLEMFEDAAKSEMKALGILSSVLKNVCKLETVNLADEQFEPAEVADEPWGEEKRLPTQTALPMVLKGASDSLKVKEEAAVDSTELKEEAQQPIEKKEWVVVPDSVEPEVFFSIQFLASRVPLTQAQIRAAYSGETAVVERLGSGWYRYSFGEFLTLEEAKQAMSREKVKGFIVAYSHNQRVTIAEALKYLKSKQ